MDKPKVRIEMSGGVIQYITASMDLDIEVVDYDDVDAYIGTENEMGYRNIYNPDNVNFDLKFLEKKEK